MKLSFYNIFIKKGNNYLLYNCFTEKILMITPEVHDLLDKFNTQIESLSNLHPTLFNELKHEKFIIDDNCNETDVFIQHQKQTDTSSDYFKIIINPTLDCNLRCWYCYEQHLKGSHISDKIEKRIYKLMENKISEGKMKYLSIGFFGGEPLMKFNSFIYPFISFAKRKCKDYNIKISFDFTTNAVLLSKKIIDRLVSENIKTRFQVPFDGGEEKHNLTKKLPNNKGTFKIILKNIEYALTKNIPFTIRCNYTQENIESFKNLIDLLSEMPNKELIDFSLQQIWQESSNQELLNKEKDLRKYIYMKGFVKKSTYVTRNKCYADRENCIVINYNGDIYKCTANEFQFENKEGVLKENGLIEYNNLYEERLKVKYKNPICLKCKILPICNICTQHKLKTIKRIGHMVECDKELKDEIIHNRISSLTNI